MILLWSHVFQGEYAQVLALKEPFLHRMAQRFHLRWYVWALCAVSLAYICLGRWDDAVAEGQRALRVAEEFADNSNGSIAAWYISWAYTAKGALRAGG